MVLIKKDILVMLSDMITPSQCRAARGLLDWNQATLADRAGVGIVTVRQFEAGSNQPRRATAEVVQRAFEAAGVEFIEENGGGPGVRLRKQQLKEPGVARGLPRLFGA